MTIFHAFRAAGEAFSMSLNDPLLISHTAGIACFLFKKNVLGVLRHCVFLSLPFKTENAGQTASLVPTCMRCPGLALCRSMRSAKVRPNHNSSAQEKLSLRQRQCGASSQLAASKSCDAACFFLLVTHKNQIKMIQLLQSRLLHIEMTHSVRSAPHIHREKFTVLSVLCAIYVFLFL